jgi:hypothetical protein
VPARASRGTRRRGEDESSEDGSSEEEDESPERIGPEDPSGIVFDPVSGHLYVSDLDSG